MCTIHDYLPIMGWEVGLGAAMEITCVTLGEGAGVSEEGSIQRASPFWEDKK